MIAHALSTKREAPIILCDDASRQYQLRPIRGQLTLKSELHAAGYREALSRTVRHYIGAELRHAMMAEQNRRTQDDSAVQAWLGDMINEHGHCGQ